MNLKNPDINKRSKQYNFSKVGKFSLQKYSYLINKNQNINDKLLKYKIHKKLFSDFFQEEETIYNPKSDIDSYFSNEDIFNKTYKPDLIKSTKNNKRKNIAEFKLKSSCSYLYKGKKTENELFKIRAKIINDNNKAIDKYRYHLLHHNESFNDLIDKKKITPSCTRYNPKLDYIYKKIIYSIPFKKMSGRQEKIKIIKNLSCNNIKKDDNKSKISLLNSAKARLRTFNDNNIHGSINMKHQLSRKSLPTHYDFRIKNNDNNNSFPNNNQYNIIEKMCKTHHGFKLSKFLVNNFNLTNNKKISKLLSSSQSSLTQRDKNFSLNNIINKEKSKIKNEVGGRSSILKNEIEKEKLKANLSKKINDTKINYPII